MSLLCRLPHPPEPQPRPLECHIRVGSKVINAIIARQIIIIESEIEREREDVF